MIGRLGEGLSGAMAAPFALEGDLLLQSALAAAGTLLLAVRAAQLAMLFDLFQLRRRQVPILIGLFRQLQRLLLLAMVEGAGVELGKFFGLFSPLRAAGHGRNLWFV